MGRSLACPFPLSPFFFSLSLFLLHGKDDGQTVSHICLASASRANRGIGMCREWWDTPIGPQRYKQRPPVPAIPLLRDYLQRFRSLTWLPFYPDGQTGIWKEDDEFVSAYHVTSWHFNSSHIFHVTSIHSNFPDHILYSLHL